jgi:hypothetical protein
MQIKKSISHEKLNSAHCIKGKHQYGDRKLIFQTGADSSRQTDATTTTRREHNFLNMAMAFGSLCITPHAIPSICRHQEPATIQKFK